MDNGHPGISRVELDISTFFTRHFGYMLPSHHKSICWSPSPLIFSRCWAFSTVAFRLFYAGAYCSSKSMWRWCNRFFLDCDSLASAIFWASEVAKFACQSHSLFVTWIVEVWRYPFKYFKKVQSPQWWILYGRPYHVVKKDAKSSGNKKKLRTFNAKSC